MNKLLSLAVFSALFAVASSSAVFADEKDAPTADNAVAADEVDSADHGNSDDAGKKKESAEDAK